MKASNLQRKGLVLATVIVGSMTLAACDNQTAELRVIHASPDAPPVNVKVASRFFETEILDLDYAQSSGYVEVATGRHDVTVDAIIPGGNAEVIEVRRVNFKKNVRYNVLAVENTADIEGLFAEESAAKPGADEVAVAVLHASPDAPPVDVYVKAPGTDISNANEMPNFSFAFKDPAVDAGPLPATSYDITVTEAGTKNVAYNISNVDLSPFAGQKLLLAALSTTNDTSRAASLIKLLVATDDAQVVLLDEDTQAGAKVVHASPDADAVAGGPVEVFTDLASPLGQVELIPAFGYTEIVPGFDAYAPLPAGDYAFDVAVDGSGPGTLYTSPVLSLEAGSEYTAIAAGLVGSTTDGFELLATVDQNRSIITQATVKIVHGAPVAGTVDVYVTPAGDFTADEVVNGLAGDPLLENFVFGQITDYVAVPPGDYDVRVYSQTLGVVAIDVQATLPAGVVATVIARQANDPAALPDNDPTETGLIVLTQ